MMVSIYHLFSIFFFALKQNEQKQKLEESSSLKITWKGGIPHQGIPVHLSRPPTSEPLSLKPC